MSPLAGNIGQHGGAGGVPFDSTSPFSHHPSQVDWGSQPPPHPQLLAPCPPMFTHWTPPRSWCPPTPQWNWSAPPPSGHWAPQTFATEAMVGECQQSSPIDGGQWTCKSGNAEEMVLWRHRRPERWRNVAQDPGAPGHHLPLAPGGGGAGQPWGRRGGGAGQPWCFEHQARGNYLSFLGMIGSVEKVPLVELQFYFLIFKPEFTWI